MVDHTDDWMHPRQAVSWQKQAEPEPRPFLIQRKKVIQCSWVGSGPPTQWDTWSSHLTREERDAELARLRKQHPAWQLRPAHETDRFGHRRVDVEDEEADLLARLQMLKLRKSKAAT